MLIWVFISYFLSIWSYYYFFRLKLWNHLKYVKEAIDEKKKIFIILCILILIYELNIRQFYLKLQTRLNSGDDLLFKPLLINRFWIYLFNFCFLLWLESIIKESNDIVMTEHNLYNFCYYDLFFERFPDNQLFFRLLFLNSFIIFLI